MSTRILHGDCRQLLRTLADKSVHCCVTSPPYFGLRDYGTGARQIGLEATPADYVLELVAVFREVWRVLRDDGLVWLNLGDSYCNADKWGGNTGKHTREPDGTPASSKAVRRKWSAPGGIKPKDLIGIPWTVAFALRDDGWHLRRDVVWNKPNPMPESITDRPATAHEYVFLLTKSARYFYDAEAVREDCQSGPSDLRKMIEGLDRIGGKHKTLDDPLSKASGATAIGRKRSVGDGAGRNLRSVWTIATAPFSEAHFATFPPKLVETCILAGTSEYGACPACGAPWSRTITKGEPDDAHRAACGADASGGYNGQSTKNHDAAGVQNASDVKRRILDGLRKKTYGWQPTCDCAPANPVPCTVLDPFSGAGTTCLVADRLGRDGIGIELNPAYAAMTSDRIIKDAGLFATIRP